MTLFWIGVAALTVLAFALLWPASRRAAIATDVPALAAHANLVILKEQRAALDTDLAEGVIDAEQHRIALAELERRVLDEESVPVVAAHGPASRRGAWWLGLAIPALAFGLYVVLGNTSALSPQPVADAPPEVTMQAVEAMVDKLAKRMESQPPGQAADLEGWTMLARSYAMLQRFPESARAYAQASALAPGDAQLLADQADVLAMTQNQSTAGEPMRLVERALKIDPNNLKALALAGSDAFQRKDFGAAIAYWTRARQGAPAGSEFADGLDRSLADARSAAGSPALPVEAQAMAAAAMPASAPVAAASAPAPSSATSARNIGGRITLAPALAARVAPTDTLFVFARAEQGPRMPVAILRRTAGELPLAFTLDDTLAMSPAMKLSGFARVVVSARISRSGNAMPQPGDLVADDVAVDVGASDLKLVIDHAR